MGVAVWLYDSADRYSAPFLSFIVYCDCKQHLGLLVRAPSAVAWELGTLVRKRARAAKKHTVKSTTDWRIRRDAVFSRIPLARTFPVTSGDQVPNSLQAAF